MAVEKLANGWRARRKKDGKTFNGPLRATEEAANEDARQMEEAAAVSSERLQEVLGRLLGSLSVPAVQKLANGWRARRKKDGKMFNGPQEVLQVLPGFGSQRKGDNSCNRLNCIVSAHVALIASCIYAFCPFAARYFFALASSSGGIRAAT